MDVKSFTKEEIQHHCKDKTQTSTVLNETVFWQKQNTNATRVAAACNKQSKQNDKKISK
jgi:hypothetical protein